MKIGCISWSHRNDVANGTIDLLGLMEHCKKDAKLDGIELWNNHFASLDKEYLEKLLKKSQELELPIYSVATKCVFGDFGEEAIEKVKKAMDEWLAATDFLGAPNMRVSIGGENLRDPKHQMKVFETLTEVLNRNEYPHIKVGIENQEPGVVQNAEDVRKMHEVSGGKLSLILDNGSFLNKEDSYQFMSDTLPYASVVHTKFFSIAEDGHDCVLDYTKIKGILDTSGYDGYLSIEYDSQESALRDVPIIADFMRTLFKKEIVHRGK